jgi:hypothetical protein
VKPERNRVDDRDAGLDLDLQQIGDLALRVGNLEVRWAPTSRTGRLDLRASVVA